MTRITTITTAGLASLAAILGAACSSTPPPAASSAGSQQATDFSVAASQMSHLQTSPVRRVTWTTTLRTTGTVDWDNDQTTQVITQISGPISRIVVDAGARVKSGEPLLYVRSGDVTGAISAYRKAKNRMVLAERTLNRTHDLQAHKAASQRDIESAEADFNDAATDLEGARQTLKIFGVDDKDLEDDEAQNAAIRPELPLRAPIAGVIVQKLVLPGQLIQAGATVAFVISNTSTVWVQGHVYDRDLTKVHVGDSVDAKNASFPEEFHGVVSYIGDMIDPATRTTPVRVVTQNPHGLLKKDLFLDLVIHDKTARDVLTVPAAAVLYDENNSPFVYLQVAPGKFAERPVQAGSQESGDIEITAGLKEGDVVVSQGSVFLQFANSSQQQ